MDKYDGIEKIKTNNGGEAIIYNFSDAIKSKHPRNIILNAHLHLEFKVDVILNSYFIKGNSGIINRKRTLFYKFLKSSKISYFSKCKLLKDLEFVGHNELINPYRETFTSLKAIGAVRNIFHHNLDYDDALKSLGSGDKFIYLKSGKKTLDMYEGKIEDLIKDFVEEANNCSEKLCEISQEYR